MFTDLTLFSLCDLQLITGTAIIVAGFAQWQTITFYHCQLVMSYWYLTLNSFWAARASSYRTIDDEVAPNWDVRYKMRSIFIIITLVLAVVFNAHQVLSDESDWDPFDSGKCYRIHDTSAAASQWLWIVGMGLFTATLCVQLTTCGRKRVKSMADFFKDICKKLGTRWIILVEDISGCIFGLFIPSAQSSRFMTMCTALPGCLYLICLTVALVVACSFVQFWAVWSAGEGFQAVEVTFFTGF